jgi:plastocyanin
MRPLTSRSVTALAPALLAVCGLVLAPATASAATTTTVKMDNSRAYHPSAVTIALGDSVRWKVKAGTFEQHDVEALKPAKFFDSGSAGGMQAGDKLLVTFASAGVYPFVCIEHSGDGMSGVVTVPIRVTRVGSPEKFKITIGSAAIPSGQPWERVVEVDLPTAGTNFVAFKTTRSASVKYTPSATGTYRFRAYLKSTVSSDRSNPSPYRSISH